MNILSKKDRVKVTPNYKLTKNDILANIVLLGKDKKNYHKILKAIALYITGKLLHTKLKSAISIKDTNPRGFNTYWSTIAADLMLDLTNNQKQIIVREFNKELMWMLNENEIIPDVSEQEYENEYEGFMKLFGSKSNLIELSSGVKLGSLQVSIPGTDKFAYTLQYHVNKSSDVVEFIESVRVFVQSREAELSEYDVELLTIHYTRYAK